MEEPGGGEPEGDAGDEVADVFVAEEEGQGGLVGLGGFNEGEGLAVFFFQHGAVNALPVFLAVGDGGILEGAAVFGLGEFGFE